jgi:hypothetical protein
MNFYGKMTADITYNGQKITASKYVAALGNTNSDVNYALPEAGYPSDFDEYPDSLVGYSVLKDTYAASTDTMVGGWVVAGSDDGGKAVITSENGNKFVRVTAGTVKKSHVLTNSISSPKTQMIFEQDVRFNSAGGVLTLTSGYPFWSNKNYTNPVTVKYNGSTITLNGTAITKNESEAAISSGVWYKIVLSVDKTTETCYVKVYDASGNLVGETENIGWSETSTPTYYSVGIANDSTGTIDFDNYSAYYPTVDESTYTLNTSADTLSIPNGDTADLTASLKTADGYDVTGLASWSIVEDDMKEGVIITPDENDSHKAKVTLSDTAESGEATVQVNIGGYIKTITLNITSSSESVKFTKSSSSVSIPLDSEPITAVYKAIVADGNGNDMGRDVTLALYDKTNTEAYTLPSGISFNESTGVLTVDSNASATAFTVRATGKNSDGESISKSIKVTVHGLSFDFGEDTDEAVAEGYTAVTKDTAYTETRGYGITGTATSGGTASTENASSDYLEGNIGFNAKVQSGKLYTVNVVYQGTLTTGYVSSDLSGYTLGTQTTLTEAEYTVPVVGDILDLKLTGTDAKLAALTITKKADKEASAKPSIYHIGDSTAANNGSWAYYIDHNRSLFPELNDIVTFCNSGAGGRNLCTYYTEGKLAEVLKNINPGDIVMFGNMGTNGMGSSFEDDVNYYLDAAEAMGARIIINSYTPHGANGSYTSVYNSSTNTFNGYRTDSYDVIVRRIASEREENDENYIGFVEIGKNADAAFNAYVADYEANGYASADAAAQAIIACFPDHNHYNNGSIARELMLNGYGNVEGIVPQLVKLLIPQVEVENVGVSTDKNGIQAAAYLASWTPNGYAATSLVWTIHNSDNTKTHTESVELPDTVISGGVTVVSGLIIQTEDVNTLGELSASLSK